MESFVFKYMLFAPIWKKDDEVKKIKRKEFAIEKSYVGNVEKLRGDGDDFHLLSTDRSQWPSTLHNFYVCSSNHFFNTLFSRRQKTFIFAEQRICNLRIMSSTKRLTFQYQYVENQKEVLITWCFQFLLRMRVERKKEPTKKVTNIYFILLSRHQRWVFNTQHILVTKYFGQGENKNSIWEDLVKFLVLRVPKENVSSIIMKLCFSNYWNVRFKKCNRSLFTWVQR